MPDPPKIETNVEELLAKVNALAAQNGELITQLNNEKAARIRTEKVAKINSLNPDFKPDEKMSAEFLDGVAHAYANPIKPKENSKGALPPTPTGGAPQKFNTPDGKDLGDKPVAIRAGNWNNTDGGSF